MKKLLLVLGIIAGLVSDASAKVKETSNYKVYEVSAFLHSVNLVKDTLIQNNTREITDDRVSHTCASTSLLFVRNYYHYIKYYEAEDFLLDLSSSVNALKALYKFNYNLKYNSEMTLYSPYNHSIKRIAVERNHWKWKKVAMAGTNFKYNLEKLKEHLKNNEPLIIALNLHKYGKNNNRNSRHCLNPAGNGGHVVIVYAYVDFKNNNKKDILVYFDPYFGGTHFIYENEIKSVSMGHSLSYLFAKP